MWNLTIRKIQSETEDTKSLWLHPDRPLPFRAGQFLILQREGQRRSYSISSRPTDPLIRITVKRIDNGLFSRYLFDEAKPGDVLACTGSSGMFVLPENVDSISQYFFLAAGSGITPCRPMIEELLEQDPQAKVVLIYSNRSEVNAIFREELLTLQKKHAARFTLEWLYSSNKNLLRARLSKWLLSELVKQHVANTLNTLFYICGPYDYMLTAEIGLITEGIPAKNIHRETFLAPELENPQPPPDQRVHQVVIRYRNQRFQITTQYPTSILKAARRQGIDLPYSCEAGQCSSCAATCVKGRVWMSRNEVLSESEVAASRVLTCTGFPVGGDVEIAIIS
ncbi:MAG: 2Fe-2S iron-sulfur cluster-binding protein [Cyclobacteriaceae bacterium]|jgi:ferredoxin-NADP reductase